MDHYRGWRRITAIEFSASDAPLLFENRLGNISFGLLSDGEKTVKLQWQSTIAEPKLVWIGERICALGIDLDVVLWDFTLNKSLLHLPLYSYFIDFHIRNGYLFVVSEVNVFRISLSHVAEVQEYGFPDVIERFEFKNERLYVTCYGGYNLEFPLP